MAAVGPGRLAGNALRVVAGAGRIPLVGRGVRAAAATMFGLRTIRAANLPKVPPYDPRGAPDMPRRDPAGTELGPGGAGR